MTSEVGLAKPARYYKLILILVGHIWGLNIYGLQLKATFRLRYIFPRYNETIKLFPLSRHSEVLQ